MKSNALCQCSNCAARCAAAPLVFSAAPLNFLKQMAHQWRADGAKGWYIDLRRWVFWAQRRNERKISNTALCTLCSSLFTLDLSKTSLDIYVLTIVVVRLKPEQRQKSLKTCSRILWNNNRSFEALFFFMISYVFSWKRYFCKSKGISRYFKLKHLCKHVKKCEVESKLQNHINNSIFQSYQILMLVLIAIICKENETLNTNQTENKQLQCPLQIAQIIIHYILWFVK